MKFVMALLVIILHRKVFPAEMEFANFITGQVICRITVPFFFIVSSFLLFKKIDPTQPQSKSFFFATEKRLILLYILWSVIYLPCNFVKSFTGHYNEITIGGLIGQVFVWIKDFIFEQSFLHLWYMNSLIFALLVVYLLLKKLSPKTVTIIFLITSVIALLVDQLLQINDYLPGPVYKLFVSSGFCISLGAYIAKNDLSVLLKKKWLLTTISFAILIAAGVIRFISKNENFYVLTEFMAYITAFCIVIVCLDSDKENKKYHKTLRNYSTLLYFSHFLIMENTFSYLAAKTGNPAFTQSNTLIFILTIIVAFTFSFIVINLSKVKGFRWLKNIY